MRRLHKRRAFTCTVSWIKNSLKVFKGTDKFAYTTANVKLAIHFMQIL